MRVIPTAYPNSNAALLDAFRHHLADRDLAPSTVQAYVSDVVGVCLEYVSEPVTSNTVVT